MPTLSIIIPVANYETELDSLLKTLTCLDDVEIIVSSNAKLKQYNADNIKYIHSESGRAQSMNTGAKIATADFLWFVHADTKLTNKAIQALIAKIKNNQNYLYYFDLEFDKKIPVMPINNFGVWCRSHILGVPFGDQAFAISKSNFNKIAGYPEDVKYGEDHLFVWYAKQQGIKLKSVNEKLVTSSRKYQQNGWLKTTLLYQYLWIKQAFPEFIKLLKNNNNKNTGALAIFVKTPELSPLKTRLANGIGKNKAMEFYLKSLKAVEYRGLEVKHVKPYYTVAEHEGLNNEIWQNLATIQSGDGDLGHRLHHVYETLLSKHDFVLLTGADSPQIPTDIINKAVEQLQSNPNQFVIGPANDGGFYLFGGAKNISKADWLNVPYSQHNTLETLLKNLQGKGEIFTLPTYTDVDEKEDLTAILNEMPTHPTKQQTKLIEWIKNEQ